MLARFVNSLPNRLSQQITKLYFQAKLINQRGSHSYSEHLELRSMDIKILPALQDNYMYLIIDKTTNEAAVVDPVEMNSVIQEVEQNGVNLTTVLTTHHHWDHAGGNINLAKVKPGLRIYGGDNRIGALTDMVVHNTSFCVGNLKIQCLATPCHTSGHICYLVSPKQGDQELAVFTGDTLFLGGCGRFFEGTAEQMYHALIQILGRLPDHTKVFCGHEYTLQNLKFAEQVEPNNTFVKEKLDWSLKQREQGKPTVPSTIGEEKLYNPFMRVTEQLVMQHAMKANAIETMNTIRVEKDNFKA